MIKTDIITGIKALRRLGCSSESRILNIIHARCMDGTGSGIMVENFFPKAKVVEVKLFNIDEYLSKINWEHWDFVFMTDCSPNEFDISKDDRIILLDHHDTANKWHNPEKVQLVINSECGTSLTKLFFECYFKKEMKHLKDMSNLIKDYDLWVHSDPRSKEINQLFLKYWSGRFRKRFATGDTEFSEDEKRHIKAMKKDFEDTYRDIDVWDLDTPGLGLFSSQTWCNEICDRLLRTEGYRLVINRNPKTKNCSIRTNIESLHAGDLLQKLGYGGGHKEAAGFNEPDHEKFREKVLTIEKEIEIHDLEE